MRILLSLGLILLAVSGILVSNPVTGQASAGSLPVLGSEWSLDSSFGNGGIARFSVTGHLYDTLISSRSFLLPGGQVLADLNISWSNGRGSHSESSQFLTFSPAGSLEGGHLGYREKIIGLQSGDRFLAIKWGNYPTPPVVQRYLADFTLDPTFAVTDTASLSYENSYFTVQPDDKVLYSRYPGGMLSRLLPDGALDAGFLMPGPFPVVGMHVLPNGDFMVQTAEPGDPEGLCAAELFDRDGMFRTRVYQGSNAESENSCVSANGITPHPDGSFVWVKWIEPYFRLYKSKPGGAQDMAFGQDGWALFELPYNLNRDPGVLHPLVQPDGKILMVGRVKDKFTGQELVQFVRYHADGSYDETFGANGRRDLSLPIDVIHSVLLQPDGKLLLAGGEGDDFVLLRLNKLPDATLTFFPFLEQCFSEVLDSPFCEE